MQLFNRQMWHIELFIKRFLAFLQLETRFTYTMYYNNNLTTFVVLKKIIKILLFYMVCRNLFIKLLFCCSSVYSGVEGWKKGENPRISNTLFTVEWMKPMLGLDVCQVQAVSLPMISRANWIGFLINMKICTFNFCLNNGRLLSVRNEREKRN